MRLSNSNLRSIEDILIPRELPLKIGTCWSHIHMYTLQVYCGQQDISSAIADLVICSLQLRRDLYGSTRLLQLTGRWQYDGVVWLTLWSIIIGFLNQIASSQQSSYPFLLMRLVDPVLDLVYFLKIANLLIRINATNL